MSISTPIALLTIPGVPGITHSAFLHKISSLLIKGVLSFPLRGLGSGRGGVSKIYGRVSPLRLYR